MRLTRSPPFARKVGLGDQRERWGLSSPQGQRPARRQRLCHHRPEARQPPDRAAASLAAHSQQGQPSRRAHPRSAPLLCPQRPRRGRRTAGRMGSRLSSPGMGFL